MKFSERKIAVTLGIMCFLLVIGICVQLKTIKNISTKYGKTQTENELRDSVLRYQQKYKDSINELSYKEGKLEELRTQASNNSNNSTGLSNTLEEYNALLGYTELIGPGVIITLSDGDGKSSNGFITDYIVHDGDILEVINSLKNAGAEAISVNGQRIVGTSSVTCVGNVVKINGEKIGAPFEISAIGSSYLLGSVSILGGYLDLMENAGIKVKVEKSNSVIIPKYNGVYKFVYAQSVEE